MNETCHGSSAGLTLKTSLLDIKAPKHSLLDTKAQSVWHQSTPKHGPFYSCWASLWLVGPDISKYLNLSQLLCWGRIVLINRKCAWRKQTSQQMPLGSKARGFWSSPGLGGGHGIRNKAQRHIPLCADFLAIFISQVTLSDHSFTVATYTICRISQMFHVSHLRPGCRHWDCT